jgi:hypothetical protein
MKEPELYKLTLEDPIETYGWKIDYSQLLTPERNVHPHLFLTDRLFESSNKNYCCLFYTVTEFSMGSYSGLMAIFENKEEPKLLTNPFNQWFHYRGDSTVSFSEGLLILRKPAYNRIKKLNGCPFVVIDLNKKKFALVDFEFDSIYYKLTPKSDSLLELELIAPREIEIAKLPNRNGETFNLKNLKYYPLELLNECFELYKKEKNSC